MQEDALRRALIFGAVMGLGGLGITQPVITGMYPIVPGLSCHYKQEWFYTQHPAMGASVLWNYGGQPAANPYVLQYYHPSELPGGAFFPDATVGIVPLSLQQFQFFDHIDASGARNLGSYYVPTSVETVSLDPQEYLRYPFAFGDDWMDTTVRLTVNGPDTTISAYDVPAWGTIVVPYGTVGDVLLVREYQVDSTWTGLGWELMKFYIYTFRTEQNRCPLTIIAIDELVFDDGTVSANGVAYWLQNETLDTSVDEEEGSGVRIGPVPATEELLVTFEQEGPAHLLLMDLQGRSIRDVAAPSGCPSGCTLYVGDLSAGTYALTVVGVDGTRTTYAVLVN